MANYKLPPRQKMINLLYIILIAMLAINISSDVLDGFHTASRDMEANVKALKGYNGALRNWRPRRETAVWPKNCIRKQPD